MASALDTIQNKIQKVPVKYRLIGFGVFVLLLIAGYLWQFYLPRKANIENLEKTLVRLQSKVDENNNKIKQLDALKAEVTSLQERLVVLTQELPPGSEVSDLLKQIQELVNQSGLILKLWKPGNRKLNKSGLYEEIPITLTLNGGYHDTAVFFDRVSKLTRIVNILNVRMGNAKQTADGTMHIDINCTAQTYAVAEKHGGKKAKKGR